MSILASISEGDAPIVVLAGSGAPARAFTAADVIPGAWTPFTLIANGISQNPTFSGMTALATSGSYNNTAGLRNFIVVGNDLWDDYYTIGSESAATYPVPTAFVGSNGTQTLTITFAGAALSTAALPSAAWFAVSGTRPGLSTLSSPLPYQIAASVASIGATSLVLKITGGTFEDGDIVTLSYEPGPPGSPLKDSSSGMYKTPGFTATVTIE